MMTESKDKEPTNDFLGRKNVDINKLKQLPNDLIRYKPHGTMLVCFQCGLKIVSNANTIKKFKCPNCGYHLNPVERFDLITMDDNEAMIITHPN